MGVFLNNIDKNNYIVARLYLIIFIFAKSEGEISDKKAKLLLSLFWKFAKFQTIWGGEKSKSLILLYTSDTSLVFGYAIGRELLVIFSLPTAFGDASRIVTRHKVLAPSFCINLKQLTSEDL